jgi:DNA invertase Pin-like site-specific DNA recombinase
MTNAIGHVRAYLRVSTDEQAESGLGLEAQRAAVERWAQTNGRTVARYYVDEDKTGRNRNRPALSSALSDIERGEGLVVAKLDRLARSIHDFSGMVLESEKGGWALTCLDPDIDLSTPNGRLVAHVLASVAEWEGAIIGQRTKDALAQLKARGVRLGAPADIPAELDELIRQKVHEEGNSYRQVCAFLNAGGIPTPRGGLEWRPSSIQRALARGGTR